MSGYTKNYSNVTKKFDLDNADPRLTSWMFNVRPNLKNCSREQIKEYCMKNSKPYAVMMAHLFGDFNFASVIRSANAFGAEQVFYFGKKKFDRRGTCGTHLYIDVNYLESFDLVRQLKSEYCFVALENVNRTHYLHEFDWKTNKKPLIILGEEGSGIPKELLDICDFQIEIQQFGSVPSVNAAVAASIAMHHFCSNHTG